MVYHQLTTHFIKTLFVSVEFSNLQKSASMLILPALFKENSNFLHCLNKVWVVFNIDKLTFLSFVNLHPKL